MSRIRLSLENENKLYVAMDRIAKTYKAVEAKFAPDDTVMEHGLAGNNLMKTLSEIFDLRTEKELDAETEASDVH